MSDRIYDLQLQSSPLMTDQIAIDRDGNIKAQRITIQQLVNLFNSNVAIGPSGFEAVTGSVLPNVTDKPKAFALVGAGTFTQTTGGSITTTQLLNILGWDGTTWTLNRSIDTSGLLSKVDYNYGGAYSTLAAANTAIPDSVVNGKNLRDGKRVDIGEPGNYVPYWWQGGFTNDDLTPFTSPVELEYESINFDLYIKDKLAITPTGDEITLNGFKGVQNFPVKPNTKYSIRGIKTVPSSKVLIEKNSSKAKIAGTQKTLSKAGLDFTTSANTYFISFTYQSDEDTVAVNPLTVQLLDLTNGAKAVSINRNIFTDLATKTKVNALREIRTDLTPYIKTATAIGSNGAVNPYPVYISAVNVPVTQGALYLISGIYGRNNSGKFVVQKKADGTVVKITELSQVPFSFIPEPLVATVSFTVTADDEGDDYSAANVRFSQVVDFLDQALDLVRKVEIDIEALTFTGTAVTSAGDFILYPVYVSALNIPVDKGMQYMIAGIAPTTNNDKFVAHVREDGSIIKTTALTSIPHVFTPDPEAYTIAFTVKGSTESNDLSIQNVKFYQLLKKVTDAPSIPKKWFKKQGVSFGDSITWQDLKMYLDIHDDYTTLGVGYQTWLRSRLGCFIDNQGRSSIDMTQIMTYIKVYNFANTDFVTITSGANDHRKGILPGVALHPGSTFNLTTYAGALQSSIEYIIASNPRTKIYLITPVQGIFTENNTSNVPGAYNGLMYISPEYAKVMKEVGQMYGIPVCDWYGESGINPLNLDTFIGDRIPNSAALSSMYLHPNQYGYAKMGELLAKFMLNH